MNDLLDTDRSMDASSKKDIFASSMDALFEMDNSINGAASLHTASQCSHYECILSLHQMDQWIDERSNKTTETNQRNVPSSSSLRSNDAYRSKTLAPPKTCVVEYSSCSAAMISLLRTDEFCDKAQGKSTIRASPSVVVALLRQLQAVDQFVETSNGHNTEMTQTGMVDPMKDLLANDVERDNAKSKSVTLRSAPITGGNNPEMMTEFSLRSKKTVVSSVMKQVAVPSRRRKAHPENSVPHRIRKIRKTQKDGFSTVRFRVAVQYCG